MKYATPSAFRNALEERLRQQSASHGISLMRLRKLVAFDRLLARLLIVAPHRWVVKGGVALDYRFGEQARTTRDLDLARHDDADATTRDLIASQHVDVGDYFAFSIERATAPDLVLEDGAIRYRAQVELDGRRFEGIVIDVGFGDPFPLTPDYLRGHDLLTFAGIQPIAVPLLPLERHLAEKLHAYTRTYRGCRGSTRVKDLIDLVLIASNTRFDAVRLREVIEETFHQRATHALPERTPFPPAMWRTPYRRLAREAGVAPELDVAVAIVGRLLDPILRPDPGATAQWHPETLEWRAEERSSPSSERFR